MMMESMEQIFERDQREAPLLTETEIAQQEEYRLLAALEALEQERETELDYQKLASIAEEFDVVAAYKIVLSGLSSRSSGSGARRNSVCHGLTLRSLQLQRTGRLANEFLCKADGGSYGYIVQPSEQVNCPKCMELIDRYGLKVCTDPGAKKLSKH
jgi:hypothetical protein